MKMNIRSFLHLLLGLLLAISLFTACNEPSNDGGGDITFPTKTAEKVLRLDGVSAKKSENGGVCASYLVDTSLVKALEEEGYTVTYGAMMALLPSEALSVTGNTEDGYRAVNPSSATVVAYATGAPSYVAATNYADGFSDHVTGVFSKASDSAFAFTLSFHNVDGEKYSADLAYGGFVAVTDAEGNQSIVYDYAENTTSMLSLADALVNGYEGDIFTKHHYNQNKTLRAVLTACGKEIRTVKEPVTLSPRTEEIVLGKPLVEDYFAAARAAYRSPEYADYLTSVVGNYETGREKYEHDIPLSANLNWVYHGEGSVTFTVTVATDDAFTKNVRTYQTTETVLSVYNLFTDTTYYYKVEAEAGNGEIFETPATTFKTAKGVRWCYVDGVRNVRDIGGWTGLNQGLVYRGSELNKTQSYGTSVTEAGIFAMKNELGVRVDFDLRLAASNGVFGTNSPLGEGVRWVQHGISAFRFEADYYTETMREFINYDNYPLFMHCVGGADRTGTVALMLEGLCGVAEEDLSIDLELTSFSKFGYRYRYDNGTYVFASTMAKIKQYKGDTLQKKFETIFRDVYGFSEAEISCVQAIMTQSGAVYNFKEGENGDVNLVTLKDGKFSFSFYMRESTTVQSVKVDDVVLDFTFDADTATVTVEGEVLKDATLRTGIGTITFDDGATLRFYVL